MSPRTAARWPGHALALALVLAGAACSGERDAPLPVPTLTAQGFRISESQTGPLGGFGDLKLRVEAPSGIEELQVHERSYLVDLARSPETSHFPLFGLTRRVWSKRDVTLDFGPYIDRKLESAGEYAFEISVRDRKGTTATATLVVIVEPAAPDASGTAGGDVPPDPEAAPRPTQPGASPAEEPTALRDVPTTSSPFHMQRVGVGPVTGAEAFGLTWKTIESVTVVIDLRSARDDPGRVALLEPDDFAAIATRDDLVRALQASEPTSSIQLATAADAAAGRVFAVANPSGGYVLQTDHSKTSLSELGTTVTLTGRYKPL